MQNNNSQLLDDQSLSDSLDSLPDINNMDYKNLYNEKRPKNCEEGEIDDEYHEFSHENCSRLNKRAYASRPAISHNSLQQQQPLNSSNNLQLHEPKFYVQEHPTFYATIHQPMHPNLSEHNATFKRHCLPDTFPNHCYFDRRFSQMPESCCIGHEFRPVPLPYHLHANKYDTQYINPHMHHNPNYYQETFENPAAHANYHAEPHPEFQYNHHNLAYSVSNCPNSHNDENDFEEMYDDEWVDPYKRTKNDNKCCEQQISQPTRPVLPTQPLIADNIALTCSEIKNEMIVTKSVIKHSQIFAEAFEELNYLEGLNKFCDQQEKLDYVRRACFSHKQSKMNFLNKNKASLLSKVDNNNNGKVKWPFQSSYEYNFDPIDRQRFASIIAFKKHCWSDEEINEASNMILKTRKDFLVVAESTNRRVMDIVELYYKHKPRFKSQTVSINPMQNLLKENDNKSSTDQDPPDESDKEGGDMKMKTLKNLNIEKQSDSLVRSHESDKNFQLLSPVFLPVSLYPNLVPPKPMPDAHDLDAVTNDH